MLPVLNEGVVFEGVVKADVEEGGETKKVQMEYMYSIETD